ncbi:MAG: hypothetical protein HY904_16085 [Deltaproteobacteria bacterium]|nr:hypothetical protein [Deltaproteobacteria bacterium]
MMGRGWWRALVLAAVTACGGPQCLPSFLGNTLEGSVGSQQDLQFDEVEIRRFPGGEIQVRYKRTSGGNNEIVAQVTVQVPSEGITYGRDIDLTTHNGSVTRVIQDGTDYPPLKSGSIRFDSGGVNDGDATRGRFAATFDNDRTLNGTFDAKLQVVQ